MTLFAATPVEAVQGTELPLGANQQSIKVYFPSPGEFLKVSEAPFWAGAEALFLQEEAWSQDEINTVLGALNDVEDLINVNFVQTSNRAVADLDFAKNDGVSSPGYASNYEEDDGSGSVRRASIVINHTITSPLLYNDPWSGGYSKGTVGYETLLTTIGMALGLGFTHYDLNGSKILEGLSPDEPGSYGPHFLNDSINSVMAYGSGYRLYETVNFQSGARASMGAWDIEALQNIYGAKSVSNAGNTTYTLEEYYLSGDAYYTTIYDTGGVDWIEGGFLRSVRIDLRDATLDYTPETSGGPASFVLDGNGLVLQSGYTIAAGSIIENARGASNDDILIGNAVGNILQGLDGDDVLSPGLGADTLDGGTGRDSYVGTVSELSGDRILNVTDLDRVFVYGVTYTQADLSIINSGGEVWLVADTGQPGERLEMILDAATGLSAAQHEVFATPRGTDTIISFAHQDDLPGDTSTSAYIQPTETGLDGSEPDLFFGVIETPGDVDYWRTRKLWDEPVAIEVHAAGANAGSLGSVTLDVYDENGVLLATDNGSAPGGVARVVLQPNNDLSSIYASVRGGTGEVGSYTVRALQEDDHPDAVFSLAGYPFFGPDYFRHHDSPHRAELEVVADHDFYGIEMIAGTSYTFEATGLTNRFGAKTDTKITLRDSSGTQIAVNNNGGPGTDPKLNFTATQNGTFFLDVSAGSGNANTRIGAYQLSMTSPDDYVDQSYDAEFVTSDGSYNYGYFEEFGDEDWFAVWMDEGETYEMTLSPIGATDWSLTVYDPDLSAKITRGPVVLYPRDVEYTAETTGVHYIGIETNYGVSVGSYWWRMNGSSAGAPSAGTPGDDSWGGGGSSDLYAALEGDDTANGGGGGDVVAGGPGADAIDGGPGADSLAGNTGNDTIEGGGGDDIILGGKQDDRLTGGNNNDTIDGGAGDDRIFGEIGRDELRGGSGDDTITGGNANDTLIGGFGNDSLSGQGEADLMDGGAGNDTLIGGASTDTLLGGEGWDSLDGGAFNDSLDGGSGNDTLLGSSGNDTLRGGEGDDSLNGGSNLDRLFGGAGNDTLDGSLGKDELQGDAGSDVLTGGSANDTLNGGAGADAVNGGSGWDLIQIFAQEGGDTLTGGSGGDTFDFQSGFGSATITDFQSLDVIDLRDVTGMSGFGDLSISYSANATVNLGGGDAITLLGISGGLAAGDFLF